MGGGGEFPGEIVRLPLCIPISGSETNLRVWVVW